MLSLGSQQRSVNWAKELCVFLKTLIVNGRPESVDLIVNAKTLPAVTVAVGAVSVRPPAPSSDSKTVIALRLVFAPVVSVADTESV